MTDPVVSIQHLQKRFGHTQALSDVSFDLYPGEVFGFIGPNGAGKSTTIRILLGMLRASGGTATVFKKNVWRDDVAIHKQVAYVPGDVFLWPNLTGGEIIDFLLRLNHQSHSARTDDLIKQFNLDPRKKARTYSKGNRQKVALIAAFSLDVALYIFDEPTSGLDPLNEEVFQQNLLHLKQQGKTVLLSSHILSEVERACDHVGVIKAGRIIKTGTLADLRQLTSTKVQVQTVQPLTDLANQPVSNLKLSGHDTQATFTVATNHLGTVMDQLANHQIVTLESTPPTLEDLFLHYYDNPGDDQHA
ncbi:ABC transporter ATP-binding protein [Levilactobacillus bambusae]|uniref:ABC transporter n=1 Tax=Levilactobacillus bambusae TaxID=2024736 RepID=A0A2V1N0V2_9LACO|nr:ABC transporter ATP-binding protein [Levilactobacillus bambusae]PWG00889.1 ABC transporter [Levilactobacillus bambusae]